MGQINILSTDGTHKAGLSFTGTSDISIDAGNIATKANPVFTGNGITIPVLASDPSGAVAGQMYYNSTDKAVKNYDGTSWTLMTNKFSVTGGTVTESGGYRIHTFTSSGTFTALSYGTVEYLIVAGGGGGGHGSGNPQYSGGGAGGVIQGNMTLTPRTYSVVIGSGGTGGSQGTSGSNTTALDFTAIGGGYGGSGGGQAGGSGGSGGGQGGTGGSLPNGQTRASGTPGQGNAGGAAVNNTTDAAGGGGGFSSAGGDGTNSTAGSGGTGLTSSITGSSVKYAGGGGRVDTGYRSGYIGSPSASANSGSGGGGSTGNGGSGIVIIRYAI